MWTSERSSTVVYLGDTGSNPTDLYGGTLGGCSDSARYSDYGVQMIDGEMPNIETLKRIAGTEETAEFTFDTGAKVRIKVKSMLNEGGDFIGVAFPDGKNLAYRLNGSLHEVAVRHENPLPPF